MSKLTVNNTKAAVFPALMLLCLLLLLNLSVFSQNRYSVKNYDNNSGLPQNEVHSLAFDRNGFLWIATYGGLCRFDGSRFETFDIKKVPALESNRISFFVKDQNDNLWAENDLQLLYNISDKLHIKKDDEKNNSKKYIAGINGFLQYDRIPPKYAVQLFANEKLGMHFKLRSYVINQNECYLKYADSIYYLNNEEGIVEKICYTDPQRGFMQSSFVMNGVYITCDGNNIRSFLKGKPRDVFIYSQLAAQKIKEACTRKGRFFLSETKVFLSVSDELYELEVAGNCINALQVNTDYIFKTVDVIAVQTEKQTRNIYIGTLSKGFFLLHPAVIKTVVKNTFDRSLSSAVYDVVTVAGGDIVNHYNRINIASGKSSLFKNAVEYERGSFYKCTNGSILCIKNNVLYRADSTFTHFEVISAVTDPYCYAEDSRHRLWFTSNTALWQIGSDNIPVKFTGTGTDVRGIFEYDASHLWLLKNGGIFVYDILNNSIGKTALIPDMHVRNVYRAHDGMIWLATYGNGIYKYENNKLLSLPADDAGALNSAHNFYEDDNGFFWIPTNNGLIQCLKKDLEDYIKDTSFVPYYYHYNKSDGLSTTEFNGGALSPYAKDSKGNIIYATANGIAFFKPLSLIPTINTGNLIIESIVVDDKSIDPAADIEIDPSFIKIEINIGVPFFGNPENLILEYNVTGLYDHWSKIDEGKRITLNRLPPGSYKLMIRKRNGFGKNNYQYKEFEFTVLPRFYQTWWFISSIAVLLIAITAGMFLLRHIRSKRRHVYLEEQIRLHTAYLNNTIEKLNSAIEELHISDQKLYDSNAAQEKIISVILHDIKTPINYLSVAAAGFSKRVRDLTYDEIEKFSRRFAETSRDINSFTQDLLQWLLVQNENFKPVYNTFSVQEFLKEMQGFYGEIAAVKNNTLALQPAEEEILINTDYNILKLIVRNLTDNAVKNTENGTITLAAASHNSYIEIVVTDNGKGISPEDLEKILHATSDKMFEGKKMGFTLINTFLKIIQGEMEITSSSAKGTSIILRFPAAPDAGLSDQEFK